LLHFLLHGTANSAVPKPLQASCPLLSKLPSSSQTHRGRSIQGVPEDMNLLTRLAGLCLLLGDSWVVDLCKVEIPNDQMGSLRSLSFLFAFRVWRREIRADTRELNAAMCAHELPRWVQPRSCNYHRTLIHASQPMVCKCDCLARGMNELWKPHLNRAGAWRMRKIDSLAFSAWAGGVYQAGKGTSAADI